MNWRLFGLALVDLQRSWLRSSLSIGAMAIGILAVAFFARELELKQEDLLTSYERAGATAIVIRLTGISDETITMLAKQIEQLPPVRAVSAPYSGVEFQTKADTSFVVFRNEHQEEGLGSEGNVLGVGQGFNFGAGYYIDFHDFKTQAPDGALGIPLLPATSPLTPPRPGEILVPTEVADYVGIGLNAEASVELNYVAANPPITRRVDGLRVIGTFSAVGPDEGRFDPFWRLAAEGQEVLTVRSAADQQSISSLPVIIKADVVRDFIMFVQQELSKRSDVPSPALARRQIIVQAHSLAEVPEAEQQITRLFRSRGFQSCTSGNRSFCPLIPESNNFKAALREHAKVAQGGAFFIALLLALITAGAGGLQAQAAVRRWREYGVLQAVGFLRLNILAIYSAQLAFTLVAAILIAALLAATLLPYAGAWTAFGLASALVAGAAIFGSVPGLLWPAMAHPITLLADS